MKKNPMKQYSFITALSFVFFALSVFSQTLADLNSDRKALLHFAATVPHTKRLNWNASTPVCSSWIGVTCNSRVTRVISVRLPSVGLAGSVPENSLGRLDALRVLSLRSNMLNGNLPSDIPSIPSLQYLYLQRNNFSGEFPSSFSHKLVVLDLSSNSISGNIPTSIQNLTRLAKLKLQDNSISGVIPNLNLPRLKLLNLSYNNLNGSIPNSLQKYPYSSFVGNSLLCGPPLKPCYTTPSPSPTPSPAFSPSSLTVVHNHAKAKRKLGVDSIIALAIGISAVLFLFALVIFIRCSKKRRAEGVGVLKVKAPSSGKTEKPKDFGSGVHDTEKNKLFFFPGCSYSFDLEDLLRASAEILGKGNNGTTYKAVLDEGSTTVVVKRLKEVLVGKKEFEQQMEIVGRVGQHPNVAPLGAYYYSKDEKLLVYNYMPSGSLFTRLHGMFFFFNLNPLERVSVFSRIYSNIPISTTRSYATVVLLCILQDSEVQNRLR